MVAVHREGGSDSRPSLASPARGGDRVVLWVDTFNNYFHPEVAEAAVEVLRAAGFDVDLPPDGLCCGRPLYDYGRLDEAKGALAQILNALGSTLDRGIPIVGLEPSCIAVFRDELPNLFPNDERARQLSERSFLLGQLLRREAPNFTPPTLRRRALVHPHCHQRSLIGTQDDAAILAMLGVDYRILDAGCCGMAGAFGFEKEHYAVSMQIGERALLPAVRAASADTLIIADGFSCREQIAQATGRQPLHLAQVIQLALREGESAR